MADTSEISLSLYQLMGAPLQALVEAETNAAFATANFIKEVGFTKAENQNKSENPDNFGDLRMITFKHERIDSNGKKRIFKTEVPLLSLVPIPALQIKDADLEFFVKITATPKLSQKTVEQHEFKKELLKGLSEQIPRELKGTIGRSQTEISRKSAMDMQIKVKIKMEQADVPAGLGKLFNLMADNISIKEENKTNE